MPAPPAEQQVRVDPAVHRDGGYRHAGLQAACDQFALELHAVLSAPTRCPYDLLVHDVHYRLDAHHRRRARSGDRAHLVVNGQEGLEATLTISLTLTPVQ